MQVYKVETLPVLVLDMDGVICKVTECWDDFAERTMIDGVPELLETLSKKYSIVLHTARIGREAFWVTVWWLLDNGLAGYFDEVIFNKPIAFRYVDDKGGCTSLAQFVAEEIDFDAINEYHRRNNG